MRAEPDIGVAVSDSTRQAGDLGQRMIEQVKAEDVGNEADLDRVFAQQRQDFAHPRFGAQGQRDPDLVDRAGRDVLREALGPAGDDACPATVSRAWPGRRRRTPRR